MTSSPDKKKRKPKARPPVKRRTAKPKVPAAAKPPSRSGWPDLSTCFAAMFDAPVVGVILVRHGGPIVDANDAFLAMVGYDRADLAAARLDYTTLTFAPDRQHEADIAAQLKQGGFATPLEKEYVKKDGTRVPVALAVINLGEF